MSLSRKHRLWILVALAAVMAATRMSHFGTSALLPDASLAVFLLAGVMGLSAGCLGLLMGAAFGIDVISAQTATEAGWCITPAYFGLIPTYALLWGAGRWLARAHGDFPAGISAVVALFAVGAAFVVSNAFWYAWSGTVGDMGLGSYALAVANYFPPYLGSAALYLVPVWLAWRLTRTWRADRLLGRDGQN